MALLRNSRTMASIPAPASYSMFSHKKASVQLSRLMCQTTIIRCAASQIGSGTQPPSSSSSSASAQSSSGKGSGNSLPWSPRSDKASRQTGKVAKFSTNAIENDPLLVEEAARKVDTGPSFLAPGHVTWEKLGTNARVMSALKDAGLRHPTTVQEMGVPPIFDGSDVVLAAETGSGKTLSYLVPILSRQHAAREANSDESEPQTALILCPNTALCAQVAEVARSLVDSETGLPLASVVAVTNDAAPPTGDIDILIATPSGLMSKLREWSDTASRWTKDEFPTWMRFVVADEADLLLSGSFIRELNRLLEVFRLDDRYRLRGALCRRFGMEQTDYANLKYHIRRAGYMDGPEGMLEAGGFEPQHDNGLPVEELGFWKRQYIFAAATMPAGGKGSAAADLRKRYPEAAWLNGNQLHMARHELTHAWEPVTQATKKEVLRRSILDHITPDSTHRTLVFVNSVAAAEGVAALLAGIDMEDGGETLKVLQYHRGIPSAERKAAVEYVRTEGNAVMVCTDSAARGLDIRGISHVIQAEFSMSAVDFLHRAGRTARAGAKGRMTSLYTEADAPLANAIRSAIDKGVPVEKAFSRKRSFRKKIKKYGESYAQDGGSSVSSSIGEDLDD